MLKGRSWAKDKPRSCASSTRLRRNYTMSFFRWTKMETDCVYKLSEPSSLTYRINVKARDAGSSFVSSLSFFWSQKCFFFLSKWRLKLTLHNQSPWIIFRNEGDRNRREPPQKETSPSFCFSTTTKTKTIPEVRFYDVTLALQLCCLQTVYTLVMFLTKTL